MMLNNSTTPSLGGSAQLQRRKATNMPERLYRSTVSIKGYKFLRHELTILRVSLTADETELRVFFDSGFGSRIRATFPDTEQGVADALAFLNNLAIGTTNPDFG